MLQIDLYTIHGRLHFVRSVAMYCVSVGIIRHFINPCFDCTSQRLLANEGNSCLVWIGRHRFFILLVFVVRYSVDTFIFHWGCCTFLQLVASCTKRAGFLSSAKEKLVIKSGAF